MAPHSKEPLPAPFQGGADYAGAERAIRDRLRSGLPKNLHYHNLAHIEDVLNAAMTIGKAEKLSAEDLNLLRIAVLFHDSGLTISLVDHEELGCQLAQQMLPGFGFSATQLQAVCGMILATRIPQNPVTLPEKIMCDADLDYLGREDFHETGEKLHRELRVAGMVKTDREWNLKQKVFLENHRYHTAYSKANRENVKQKHLQEVIARLKK
jgi:predicted metal-dependent HD superfamily phosphohydrolase